MRVNCIWHTPKRENSWSEFTQHSMFRDTTRTDRMSDRLVSTAIPTATREIANGRPQKTTHAHAQDIAAKKTHLASSFPREEERVPLEEAGSGVEATRNRAHPRCSRPALVSESLRRPLELPWALSCLRGARCFSVCVSLWLLCSRLLLSASYPLGIHSAPYHILRDENALLRS